MKIRRYSPFFTIALLIGFSGCSDLKNAPGPLPQTPFSSGMRAASEQPQGSSSTERVYAADWANGYVDVYNGQNFLSHITDGLQGTANANTVATDARGDLYLAYQDVVVVYDNNGFLKRGIAIPSGYYGPPGPLGQKVERYYGPSIISLALRDDVLYVGLAVNASCSVGEVLEYQTTPYPQGWPANPRRVLYTPAGDQKTSTNTASYLNAVGVDDAGNVYVEYTKWGQSNICQVGYPAPPVPATLLAFRNGSNKGNKLGITLQDGATSRKVAVDNRGDLVACDDYTNQVDIFAPGKSKPARTIQDAEGCWGFALSQDESAIYVASDIRSSTQSGSVNVYDYSSGKLEYSLQAPQQDRSAKLQDVAVDPPAPLGKPFIGGRNHAR